MEYTKGEWKADRDNIIWCGEHSIASILPHTKSEEEYNGNTQLIASSPDLYEALKEFLASEFGVAPNHLIKKMISALAKAEGK